MIGLFRQVSEIKGIGAFYTSLLAEEGVTRLVDLLWLFPKKIFKTNVTNSFTDEDIDKDLTLNVTITSGRFFPKVVFIETLTSSEQKLTLIFFKSCYAFRKGAKLCVSGKLLSEDGKFVMRTPRWREGNYDDLLEIDYKIDKMPNAILSRIIHQAISLLSDTELIDTAFLGSHNLRTVKSALQSIHSGFAEERDWDSIAFAELLSYRIGLLKAKAEMTHLKGNLSLDFWDVWKYLEEANFILTEDQEYAWKEIIFDLTSSERMLRMLYGDVGSGKTILAVLAAALVYKNKKQAAVLVPTQILALQHYEVFKQILPDIPIVLLTSATKTKSVYHTIATEPCIIIGTHALLEPTVKYHSLAFFIIDEHHRFGVLQRLALAKMGLHYHLLIMSATPIPRTLKLLLMENIEISKLKNRPQNHRDISVATVYIKNIDLVYEKVRAHLESGDNVFWVCPFIKPSEVKEGMDVGTRADLLREIFGDVVTILHGKLKQKDEILFDFKDGKGRILVSTTVIEVGVNVPSANLMIVENSEHFGLSQLYQLIGRVGRGSRAGECYLIYKNASSLTQRRLEVLKTKNSGLEIAEADMLIRGYGNVLGTQQNGHFSDVFKVFDPEKHLFVYDKTIEYIKYAKENSIDLVIPDLFEQIKNPFGGG